ncbi:hypothetical protein J6590_072889 [Homalodisca vitripennis]|nr:hypothetical protein J6590_072889 [Homalodisca vitripennis]
MRRNTLKKKLQYRSMVVLEVLAGALMFETFVRPLLVYSSVVLCPFKLQHIYQRNNQYGGGFPGLPLCPARRVADLSFL